MARQKKTRKICGEPLFTEFGPKHAREEFQIVMSVDEYETIRLMDYEGLSQEECAKRMNVARTTVTQIYESAREKIAKCIVEGRMLSISGGSYEVCQGDVKCCSCTDK